MIHPFPACLKLGSVHQHDISDKALNPSRNSSYKYQFKNICKIYSKQKLRVSVVINRYEFSMLFSKGFYTIREQMSNVNLVIERVGKRLVQPPPSKINNLMSFSPVLNEFQAACRSFSPPPISSIYMVAD